MIPGERRHSLSAGDHVIGVREIAALLMAE